MILCSAALCLNVPDPRDKHRHIHVGVHASLPSSLHSSLPPHPPSPSSSPPLPPPLPSLLPSPLPSSRCVCRGTFFTYSGRDVSARGGCLHIGLGMLTQWYWGWQRNVLDNSCRNRNLCGSLHRPPSFQDLLPERRLQSLTFWRGRSAESPDGEASKRLDG